LWRVADIDFTAADSRHRSDTTLFYLLIGASFVEKRLGVCTTRNLLTYYRDDAPIADWLNNTWEPEELQHGGPALRAYVSGRLARIRLAHGLPALSGRVLAVGLA